MWSQGSSSKTLWERIMMLMRRVCEIIGRTLSECLISSPTLLSKMRIMKRSGKQWTTCNKRSKRIRKLKMIWLRRRLRTRSTSCKKPQKSLNSRWKQDSRSNKRPRNMTKKSNRSSIEPWTCLLTETIKRPNQNDPEGLTMQRHCKNRWKSKRIRI